MLLRSRLRKLQELHNPGVLLRFVWYLLRRIFRRKSLSSLKEDAHRFLPLFTKYFIRTLFDVCTHVRFCCVSFFFQLRYMFTALVPLSEAMSGRLIVDVGSRLGAVLYASYLYGFVHLFVI